VERTRGSARAVIEIGTAIVSYIEPHPGQARAFNTWYERDHFPAAVLAGPGVFSGARFVATAACKQLRPATGRLFGDPLRGSYLAVAWVLPGQQAVWDEWVTGAMDELVARGRMFAGRDHVHTAVYRYAWQAGEIPASMVLAHGSAGVLAVSSEKPVEIKTHAHATVGLALERTILSEADPPPHELVLAFCSDDPIAQFSRLALDDAWFASAFLATIPGTDAYVEEL
jgi:hypothetical protein